MKAQPKRSSSIYCHLNQPGNHREELPHAAPAPRCWELSPGKVTGLLRDGEDITGARELSLGQRHSPGSPGSSLCLGQGRNRRPPWLGAGQGSVAESGARLPPSGERRGTGTARNCSRHRGDTPAGTSQPSAAAWNFWIKFPPLQQVPTVSIALAARQTRFKLTGLTLICTECSRPSPRGFLITHQTQQTHGIERSKPFSITHSLPSPGPPLPHREFPIHTRQEPCSPSPAPNREARTECQALPHIWALTCLWNNARHRGTNCWGRAGAGWAAWAAHPLPPSPGLPHKSEASCAPQALVWLPGHEAITP